MKIHSLAVIIVVILAWRLHLTRGEILVLLLTVGGVVAAEMFNTAVETIVDLIAPDYHPVAGVIKDIAAGAVLVMSLIAAAVGIILVTGRL